MQSQGESNEKYLRGAIDELRAEFAGLNGHIMALDERYRQLRETTFSAFNQLSQWDAADGKARKERQTALDAELRLIRVGIVVLLVVQVVSISVFIGFALAGG